MATKGFAARARETWGTFFALVLICAFITSAVHIALLLTTMWWFDLVAPIGRLVSCLG